MVVDRILNEEVTTRPFYFTKILWAFENERERENSIIFHIFIQHFFIKHYILEVSQKKSLIFLFFSEILTWNRHQLLQDLKNFRNFVQKSLFKKFEISKFFSFSKKKHISQNMQFEFKYFFSFWWTNSDIIRRRSSFFLPIPRRKIWYDIFP